MKMETDTKKGLLQEAVRIADELLAKAEKGKRGISWETMNSTEDRSITWHKSPVIYNGVAGIALFLVELFLHTRNEKYLRAAIDGMKWVENDCEENPDNFWAFLTGRMGIAYTMLRMASVTGDTSYLEKASAIARPCSNFLDSPYFVDDLINGSSGILLVLLHLHAATAEKWLFETMDRFIKHLIENAHHGLMGLYWDRSIQSKSGLCGLSHGSAGIGLVFLELGRYFHNHAFYWLAEQAFLYESQFFDSTQKNWQDLRQGIYTDEDYEKHEKAFLAGDLDFFTKKIYMNAWCHGAAGIGLSRLRAFELLKNPGYKEQTLSAIEKTIMTDVESKNPRPSFTLCHGSSGNAELFLEAYRRFKNKRYWHLAKEVALKALAYKTEQKIYYSGFGNAGDQEDTSLFMGNAGIGYFYLRVLDPRNTPSILMPYLNSTCQGDESLSQYPFISINLHEIQKKIMEKYFRRTLSLAEKIMPHSLDTFCRQYQTSSETGTVSLKDSFARFMDTKIPTLEPEEKRTLLEVLSLEQEKVLMDDAIISHALLHIKKKVQEKDAEKLMELNQEKFLDLTLILDPEVKLRSFEWNWSLKQPEEWVKNLDLEPGPDTWFSLLRPSPLEVQEVEISPFAYVIFSAFAEKNQVKEAVKEAIEAFESLTPEEEEIVRGKALEQIKQALQAGILTAPPEQSSHHSVTK